MQKMTLISMMKMQTGNHNPGQQSVGDTSATLAWRPGDSGRKNWFSCSTPVSCAFRIKYPNGTVDVFRGWLSDRVKPLPQKT
ncbi:phage tail tube protein [Shigella flexneri]